MRSPVRALVSFLDLDGPENDGRPRLTKVASVATLGVGLSLTLGGLALRVETAFWPGVALAFLGLCAVFGRKHLDALLSRISISFGGQASASAEYRKEDVTVRQILERRDPERGVEPTP